MAFNCMLCWIVEFDGCRSCFFLKCYSVGHEDGINIVAIGAARLFDLGIGKDGIVNNLIDIGSDLIFSDFFNDD